MPTEPPDTSDCAVPPGDPSAPTGPLHWSPERLKEDWPAPVRPEPAGGGGVQPIPLTYLEPMGDSGSDAYPCVDIRGVTADTSEVHLKLDSSQHVVDPADAWIAYGVVIDDDRDGVPDWRYGIDNMPVDAAVGGPHTRVWRTDLHTGQTDAGPALSELDPPPLLRRGPKTEYPRIGSDAVFLFGGARETTTGSAGWGIELDMPFYTWASVIVDGRVVATDYAPDAGWLVAPRGVRPGGTFLLGNPFPHLSMTVPEGWTTSSTQPDRLGGEGELKRVACREAAQNAVGTSDDADCAGVRFDVIDDPEELCGDDSIEPPLGSSLDDLVTYVAGPAITEIADVTVDGYRGKYFEYSQGDEDPVYCLSLRFKGLWILDVDGVRLMIGSALRGDQELDVPEEAVKTEIREMVESIRFER